MPAAHPPDASRIPKAFELRRRLEANPTQRGLVIKRFFEEMTALGDTESAAWALEYLRSEEIRERAQKSHETEIENIKKDRMSPLLKLMIILGFISGVIFGLLGIWLVYLGATGTTEVSFFYQTAKSTNVGIVSIFLGAAIIVLLMKSILKTMRSSR